MSARRHFQGDFLGFSYGTKTDGTPMHSSDLGIVRTSNGSRFDENLLPTMQDKTVQVPGGDGTYYFGSYYTQRQFSVPFAFDDLTEEEFKLLKKHFGGKEIRDLFFDEKPDRIYSAKVTGTATIKHIPFNENGMTIYKGEGSIQFTCYYPFARATSPQTGGVNEGDVPVPFTLVLSGSGSTLVNGHTIEWKLPTEYKIEETAYPARGVLNTRTGIVEQEYKTTENGKEIWKKTGAILNKYVTGNLTVKIPVGAEAPEGAVFYCEYI